MINSEFFLDKVQESFKWLTDMGYQFKRVETNIVFELVKEDEAFAIGFSWAEYNQIHIHGVMAYKRFSLIEEIIQKVTGSPIDYTIKYHWKGEIPEELERISDESNPFYNSFYLANDSQVELFSNMVKNFLHQEVNGFFKQFETIQDVLKWLGIHEVQQHGKLLVQNNNTGMLRKLILMKEGRSEDFGDLYRRYVGFLKDKHSKKESPYAEMYAVFLKLDVYFNYSA